MFFPFFYLSVVLQLFLLSWLKKVHCLQEIVESHQCSLVQCCWSSRILLPWRCRKSVRKWYRALLCSLLSSCSCGYLHFYMVACTTLTCPMQPFPQLCTTTTGWYWSCPVALEKLRVRRQCVERFTLSFSFFHVLFCRTDCESPASHWCSYPVANISMIQNRKHVCAVQPYLWIYVGPF